MIAMAARPPSKANRMWPPSLASRGSVCGTAARRDFPRLDLMVAGLSWCRNYAVRSNVSRCSPGYHSTDRRLYRARESRICANCGELTPWRDERLEMAICSEECQHTIQTGGGPLSAG